MSFDRKIKDIIGKKKNGKWPILEYNYKSLKYKSYVYNISVNGIELWEGSLEDVPPGSYWRWSYYAKTEDRCAKEVYKMLVRYLKQVARMNKKMDNKKFNRHIRWDNWIRNYQLLLKSGK